MMGRAALALGLLLAAAAPGGTADLFGKERVELTPFYGYRVGGNFSSAFEDASYSIDGAASYGGIIDFNLNYDNFKIEALYSRQETQVKAALIPGLDVARLNIEYLQAGIMQEVGEPKARLSVSLLLGATKVSPPGFSSETRFSASVGGALKIFPTAHFGLRLDARAYATFVGGSGGAFCAGGCIVVYNGSTFWQGDFTGGIILAF